MAYGTANGYNDTQVIQATRAELAAITQGVPLPPPATAIVSGTVTGQGAGESTYAALKVNGNQGSGSPFTFKVTTEKGINDLFVASHDGNGQATRCLLQRGLDIQGDRDLGTLDLASAGVATVALPLTVNGLNGLNGGQGDYWTTFMSSNGTWLPMGGGTTTGTAVGRTLPSGSRVSGDLHRLFASSGDSGSWRQADKWFNVSDAPSLDLPPALPGVQASFAPSSTQFRAQWSALPGTTLYWIGAGQAQGEGFTNFSMVVTPGWLGSGASLQATQPDFTGITGFDARWAFTATDPLDWEVDSYAFSSGVSGWWTYWQSAPKAGDFHWDTWVWGTLGGAPSVQAAREFFKAPFGPRTMERWGFQPFKAPLTR